jgi:hypothetical protein
MPDRDPHVGPKLCNLVCLYRLVDILHALEVREKGRQPVYSRMAAIGVSPDMKREWPFRDWVQTLCSCRSTLKVLIPDPGCSPYKPVPVKLFEDLYVLDRQIGGTRILFNIQAAAIHLHFYLCGEKERLALPGLPAQSWLS